VKPPAATLGAQPAALGAQRLGITAGHAYRVAVEIVSLDGAARDRAVAQLSEEDEAALRAAVGLMIVQARTVYRALGGDESGRPADDH
jgi:hypothetical protein